MRTPSSAYWKLRARQRMAGYHRDADTTIKVIMAAYDKAQSDINLEIQKIFDKFAKDGKLDPKVAAKMLNETVSDKEWDDLKKRLNTIQDPDIRREMLSRLNAPAYKARVTRLQMLREQIYLAAKEVADVEIRASKRAYIKVIDESYYQHMFDIQKGLGVGFDFAAVPVSTVQEILTNPWSGEQFSARVWANTDVLASSVTNIMTAGFLSGSSIARMREELTVATGNSKFAASRLLRTEYTYMANAAEMEAYKEADIEKYIFVATLDLRTSPQCRKADGNVFAVKDAVPGTNMPPLHVFCRSTTRGYFGKDTQKGIERRARDPITGESQLVPASMKYPEWHKEYVEGKHGADRVAELERQMQNRTTDKILYKRYKQALGKEAPKTYAEFIDTKYGSGDDWVNLKKTYIEKRKKMNEVAK